MIRYRANRNEFGEHGLHVTITLDGTVEDWKRTMRDLADMTTNEVSWTDQSDYGTNQAYSRWERLHTAASVSSR